MKTRLIIIYIMPSIIAIIFADPVSFQDNDGQSLSINNDATKDRAPRNNEPALQCDWKTILTYKKKTATPTDRFIETFNKLCNRIPDQQLESFKVSNKRRTWDTNSKSTKTNKISPINFTTSHTSRRVKMFPQVTLKKKVIAEDDLMRMHYSPEQITNFRSIDNTDEESISKFRPFSDILPPVYYKPVKNKEKIMIHGKSVQSQFYNTRTANISASTTYHPLRATHSIYELIVKNGKNDFKPMVKLDKSSHQQQTERGARLEHHHVSIEHASPEYTILLHVNDSSPNKNRNIFDDSRNRFSKSNVNYFFNDKNDKRKRKSGKFFDQPIVIMDESTSEPLTTIKSYNQLLDSFGYNGDSNENKNESSLFRSLGEWHLNYSDTSGETIDRNDSTVEDNRSGEPVNTTFYNNCTIQRDSKSCETKKIVFEKKAEIVEGTWNFLFNVIGIRFADLMSPTLKSNIFMVKRLLVECYSDFDQLQTGGNTIDCLKEITFKVLNRAVKSNVVKISDTVSLIKENETAVQYFHDRALFNESYENSNWLPTIIDKIQELFTSHSLKIKLMEAAKNGKLQIEGRRQHHWRRIFPVVAGIYMAITAIIIPVAFQFMATMGGKSFIISKLALLYVLFSSFSRFFGAPPTEAPSNSVPPLHYPPYLSPYQLDHTVWRKFDRH